MKKVQFQVKSKLCLCFLGFENINMYSKGNYRIRLQAIVTDQKCKIFLPHEKQQQDCLNDKQSHELFTKEFAIKYQNQKIELNELMMVETPMYKYNKQLKIFLKISLLRAQAEQKDKTKIQYTQLTSTFLMVRFSLNSICEYCQCFFQQPFLSSLSLVILSQPIKISIQTKVYKHANEQQLLLLKKQVKRLRYNNYLLHNKFKKIVYNQINYQFTLPRMFIHGGQQMVEISTNQEMFLNYLISYQKMPLTPENMNYQLFSIGLKNEELLLIFKANFLTSSIFTSKLKLEYEDKESKRLKKYITKQEHKGKFCDQYIPIIKQKLKLLHKQVQLHINQQTLNNLTLKIGGSLDQCKLQTNRYPIIVHEIERVRSLSSKDKQQEINEQIKIRYVFILAHGYQGCPEDLNAMANGLKRRFKKSKYLILKSYKYKMEESMSEMSKSALQQINVYLNTLDFEQKDYLIVMVGHSMGGLILRSICNLINHKQNLYGYISLGTPHLGYLQGIQLIIRAGISLFSNLYNVRCLNELSIKDNAEMHDCLLYKISSEGTLSNFKKIMLVSSVHDKYVSWHSARLQNFNKDLLKQYNFIEQEMISLILGKEGKIQRIDRLEVEFKLSQNNMDKIIGRSSHIKFLNDSAFIELFINGCVVNTLQQ